MKFTAQDIGDITRHLLRARWENRQIKPPSILLYPFLLYLFHYEAMRNIEISELTGMKANSTYERLRRLAILGYAYREGLFWKLTEKGREFTAHALNAVNGASKIQKERRKNVSVIRNKKPPLY